MVSFIVYDVAFLVLFTLGVIYFIHTRKHNLKRQGFIYLYRTKLGILFMDRFAKKFSKILMPLQYIVLTSGYLLMAAVSVVLIQSVWSYLTNPLITATIKAPPIAPLIPYFPALFGLDSFFPPLYFTYFLIALAVVAISHEASHGIFARLYRIKIHSTGFVFLGPILGAFVEPDEKASMNADKFKRLVILGAGTFANVVMTLIFAAVMWIFFISFFSPAGVYFNSYSTSVFNVSELEIPNNFSIDSEFTEVYKGNSKYFASTEGLKKTLDNNLPLIAVYEDTSAFNAKLRGAIIEIDGKKTRSADSLREEIMAHNPGDIVNIKTAQTDGLYDTKAEIKEYNLAFGEKDGKAYLGVGIASPNLRGISGLFYIVSSSIKDPLIYYESDIGDFGWFVYYLLWWIIVINILVALFNMLPLGSPEGGLDGGPFFYLTMWGLTGNEKAGRRALKISTWIIIAIFIILMIRWVFIFI